MLISRYNMKQTCIRCKAQLSKKTTITFSWFSIILKLRPISFALVLNDHKCIVPNTFLNSKIQSRKSCHFLVKDSSEWFWIENLCYNILWILVFQKAPYLVPRFFFFTLITLEIISSVILLFMLMILVSTLSEIKLQICDNN